MRRKPYTSIGIKRIPCKKCGKPSVYQWSSCSLGNSYFGVCADCDIRLNNLLLVFFDIDNRVELIDSYRKRVLNAAI